VPHGQLTRKARFENNDVIATTGMEFMQLTSAYVNDAVKPIAAARLLRQIADMLAEIEKTCAFGKEAGPCYVNFNCDIDTALWKRALIQLEGLGDSLPGYVLEVLRTIWQALVAILYHQHAVGKLAAKINGADIKSICF